MASPDGRAADDGIDVRAARQTSAAPGIASATAALSAIPHATASIPSSPTRATMSASPAALATAYPSAGVT